MSPRIRRTTSPLFKSIAGMTVNFLNKTDWGLGRERPLGGEHSRNPGLQRACLIHSPRERFEHGFDDVMRVAPGMQVQMQVEPGLIAECLHEVLHQLGWKVSNPFLRHRYFVRQVRAAADIHHRRAQGFVQRHRGLTKAADSRAIAQRLLKGAAQHNAHVFDRMMLVDVQVAVGFNLEVEEPMASEAFEHVVEKRNPGRDLAVAGAVDFERNLNLRLAGLAFYFRRPPWSVRSDYDGRDSAPAWFTR